MQIWCWFSCVFVLQTWGNALITIPSKAQLKSNWLLLAKDAEAEETDPTDDLTIVDKVDNIEVNNQATAETIETPGPNGSPKENETSNLAFITSIGATTNRGEFSTETQKQAIATVVQELESCINDCNDASGTWELVYTNTQLFRGSPFFLAGRATCQTQEDREKYDWFCEMHRQALAISQIQAVRQIITESSMTNEFEVSVGSIPFLNDFTPFSYSGGLPVTITGAIVSTASLSSLTKDGFPMVWELFMDSVEIKGSNIPLLRQILDLPQVKLPTRRLSSVLTDNISSYQTPKPILQTTYLTDKFRITRDQDDNIFVYVRTSSSTTPTDYSSRSSDLGITRLLEGFNDAVSKLYL